VFRSERYPQPWKLTGPTPPRRIETQRLVLRCWEPADAHLFASALRVSREHIGAWIPPTWDEPSELDDIARRLEQFRAEFHAGIGFVYAMLDTTETEVVGEAGLMPRLGPGALEIGYWVHVDHVGRGLGTEATHAPARISSHPPSRPRSVQRRFAQRGRHPHLHPRVYRRAGRLGGRRAQDIAGDWYCPAQSDITLDVIIVTRYAPL
jgi:hypothetical protein